MWKLIRRRWTAFKNRPVSPALPIGEAACFVDRRSQAPSRNPTNSAAVPAMAFRKQSYSPPKVADRDPASDQGMERAAFNTAPTYSDADRESHHDPQQTGRKQLRFPGGSSQHRRSQSVLTISKQGIYRTSRFAPA